MPSISTLLSKYDVAGPRYTSYPTAPAWTDSVGPEQFRQALSSVKNGEPLSLYFHIPFCENLCHFCGCMKFITKDHSRSREYVDYLLKEIDLVASLLPKNSRIVSQMHFGGGSPNFLQPEELKEIVDRVRSLFTFLPNAEIAIEMHPRTSTPAFCEMLAELKFNRISLGVQDFDPLVQKLINRHQTYEMTEQMVLLLKRLGFHSFNFDLIYGLPGQTLEGWIKTLNQALELKPNRLAVYSYAHIPWLKPYQRSFEDKDLPSPELKIKLFEAAYHFLLENGYCAVGMDHFCLANDDMAQALNEGTLHRNFMGYSTKADAHQIGMGVSSISYVSGHYFQNEKELKNYYTAIGNDKLATHRGCLLSQDDAIRRDLIQRIMCNGFVDILGFEKEWGINFRDYFKHDLPKLAPMIEDGLVQLSDEEFRAVGMGHLFLRNVAMVFDQHLEGIRAAAKNPVFSRTV